MAGTCQCVNSTLRYSEDADEAREEEHGRSEADVTLLGALLASLEGEAEEEDDDHERRHNQVGSNQSE